MKVTTRVDDPGLVEVIESFDSKSEAVREGLRAIQRKQIGRQHDGLTDKEATAYNWFLDRCGVGGQVSLKTAKNRLSQKLSIAEKDIPHEVIKPLEQAGRLGVKSRFEFVNITVFSPGDDVDASDVKVAGPDEDLSVSYRGRHWGAPEDDESDDAEDEPTVEEQWERMESATPLGGESDD